jgi:hypothetical protein
LGGENTWNLRKAVHAARVYIDRKQPDVHDSDDVDEFEELHVVIEGLHPE